MEMAEIKQARLSTDTALSDVTQIPLVISRDEDAIDENNYIPGMSIPIVTPTYDAIAADDEDIYNVPSLPKPQQDDVDDDDDIYNVSSLQDTTTPLPPSRPVPQLPKQPSRPPPAAPAPPLPPRDTGELPVLPSKEPGSAVRENDDTSQYANTWQYDDTSSISDPMPSVINKQDADLDRDVDSTQNVNLDLSSSSDLSPAADADPCPYAIVTRNQSCYLRMSREISSLQSPSSKLATAGEISGIIRLDSDPEYVPSDPDLGLIYGDLCWLMRCSMRMEL